MREPTPLTSLMGLPIYGYSVILCLSILAGLGLMALCQGKRGLPKDAWLRFGLWALPLGVVGARLLYCLARWDYVFLERGWPFLFYLWEGGFALFGALPGCLLAALVYSKLARVKVGAVLDCAAPGAALVLVGARFAEALTTQGVGRLVESGAWQHFPFAVMDQYGDWVLPVFFWEGAAALVLCLAITLRLLHKKEKPGDAALLFLLLFGAAQVLLESLRGDDYLRWGFVKVSQVASMGLVLAVGVIFGIRMMKYRKAVPLAVAGFTLLAAGVGGCVAIEFALDKSSISDIILYAAMALILIVMTLTVLFFKNRATRMPTPAVRGFDLSR